MLLLVSVYFQKLHFTKDTGYCRWCWCSENALGEAWSQSMGKGKSGRSQCAQTMVSSEVKVTSRVPERTCEFRTGDWRKSSNLYRKCLRPSSPVSCKGPRDTFAWTRFCKLTGFSNMSPEAETRHLADAAVRKTFVVFLFLFIYLFFVVCFHWCQTEPSCRRKGIPHKQNDLK